MCLCSESLPPPSEILPCSGAYTIEFFSTNYQVSSWAFTYASIGVKWLIEFLQGLQSYHVYLQPLKLQLESSFLISTPTNVMPQFSVTEAPGLEGVTFDVKAGQLEFLNIDNATFNVYLPLPGQHELSITAIYNNSILVSKSNCWMWFPDHTVKLKKDVNIKSCFMLHLEISNVRHFVFSTLQHLPIGYFNFLKPNIPLL